MRFYVGQPVICINGNFSHASRKYPGCTWPKRGRRYTVRGYAIEDRWPAVLLAEISNRKVRYSDGTMREAGFWEERFAPVTDISDLIEIARSTSIRKPARKRETA